MEREPNADRRRSNDSEEKARVARPGDHCRRPRILGHRRPVRVRLGTGGRRAVYRRHPPRRQSGVDWVDTAPVYGKGHSEEVVGKALEPYRTGEEVFVFTKCGRNYYGSTGKISSDLRPETIRWECEESLKRLKVERIDLLQFHWPDRDSGTPIEDSWATLGELIDEGKVRWGGLSNCDVPFLERCEAVRHVDSLQPPLNLINRAARNDVIPWCDTHGVGVIVYAPMAWAAHRQLRPHADRTATGQ